MSKKQLDYHEIEKAETQQLTANIGVLAKQSGVKPSDFKNRKAYLNYVARLAGFDNYTQWQNARRKAQIQPHRGGRKPQKVEYLYNLKKFVNFSLEEKVIDAYFVKTNKGREDEVKKIDVDWYNKKTNKHIYWRSEYTTDITYLLSWLYRKFSYTSPKLVEIMGDNSKAKIYIVFYETYKRQLAETNNVIPYTTLDEEPEILF